MRLAAFLRILVAALPCTAADSVVLSEFMAANTRTQVDETGSFEDWIELRNNGTTAVNLENWSLTVHPGRTRQWLFPATNLPPDGCLLVWASGRDRRTPGQPLHTNFKLAREGHYLALRRPDGSAATEFAPGYPPQWPDASFGFLPGSSQPVVFVSPTPGKRNELARIRPGPFVESVIHSPREPEAREPISIAARILPAVDAIADVTLHWRAMFQREESVAMTRAGNDTWTASLPAEVSLPGKMVRWRVTARDDHGAISAYPPATDPKRSSRYLGTISQPNPVLSALPVYQLFMAPAEMARADSEQGSHGCCLYYDGEFYDNVFVKVRGNSTAGFPKKSHRLEFPVDHAFRHAGPGERTRHTSLMAEWGDPTYLRQHLSFWFEDQAGLAAPFHFPVRVQLNGEFWQLALHSEVLGKDLLARHGLDPRGALYKAVGTLTPEMETTGGFEKKTRRNEGLEDYLSLARALDDGRSLDARRQALFDRMNLPAVINYLAASRITQEDDDVWANMSLYHDNEGTGEWRVIPFDTNVSWGYSFAHGGIQSNADNYRSHPFFGASDSGMTQGYNRLYDAVVHVPETREMLLRRMRTLLDRFWQPPDTPIGDRILERHIAQMTNVIAADAILDRRKWGDSWYSENRGTQESSLASGVEALVTRFIEPRRKHLYVTHSVANAGWTRRIGITSRDIAGIPLSQAQDARVDFVDPRPESTTGAMAHFALTNVSPYSVDISGWSLSGPVTYKLPEGTVLPVHAVLHIVADVKTFRAGFRRPPTEPARFIVGNLTPNPAGPRSVTLSNERGKPVAVLGTTRTN